MTEREDFELLLPKMAAIPDEQLLTPRMAVAKVLHEAQGLLTWAREDKTFFIEANFDWSIVDALQLQTGALNEAESIWIASKNVIKEINRQLNELLNEGQLLIGEVTSAMDLAFYGNEDLLDVVQDIRKATAQADIPLSLNILNKLGINNKPLLEKINFMMTKLDRCTKLSEKIGEMLGAASSEKLKDSEERKNRDRAYTLCKESMDTIRRFGKYALRNNKNRLQGYCSIYQQKLYRKRKNAIMEEEAPVAAEVAAE